jgi:hypothetical protein
MHKAAQRLHHEADIATWAKEVWNNHRALQANQQETGSVSASLLQEHLTTAGALSSLGMSSQEQKRLEIERGQGGDQDRPYLFTLPVTQKERLAWIRLQKQVQAGELLS